MLGDPRPVVPDHAAIAAGQADVRAKLLAAGRAVAAELDRLEAEIGPGMMTRAIDVVRFSSGYQCLVRLAPLVIAGQADRVR